MINVYKQYITNVDLTNNTDEDQVLEVQFRYFSPQFTEERLLRIIETMDKLSDDCLLDVDFNGERIFNN